MEIGKFIIMENEEITKKALELLFGDVTLVEHLDLIDYAIKDYQEEFKCDLDEDQAIVDNLKKCYWAIEEEMAYEMAVKNF